METELNNADIIPKYCFICGDKLEECGMGYYQCKSDECAEVYLPFITDNQYKYQALMHIRTPFSPK